MSWRKKLLRRAKREEARQGVTVQPQANGDQEVPTQVHKMTVSQETLDLLIQGRATLLQRRQALIQQLQELDAAIQQQEGGIRVLENLLAGQQAETQEAVRPDGASDQEQQDAQPSPDVQAGPHPE